MQNTQHDEKQEHEKKSTKPHHHKKHHETDTTPDATASNDQEEANVKPKRFHANLFHKKSDKQNTEPVAEKRKRTPQKKEQISSAAPVLDNLVSQAVDEERPHKHVPRRPKKKPHSKQENVATTTTTTIANVQEEPEAENTKQHHEKKHHKTLAKSVPSVLFAVPPPETVQAGTDIHQFDVYCSKCNKVLVTGPNVYRVIEQCIWTNRPVQSNITIKTETTHNDALNHTQQQMHCKCRNFVGHFYPGYKEPTAHVQLQYKFEWYTEHAKSKKNHLVCGSRQAPPKIKGDCHIISCTEVTKADQLVYAPTETEPTSNAAKKDDTSYQMHLFAKFTGIKQLATMEPAKFAQFLTTMDKTDWKLNNLYKIMLLAAVQHDSIRKYKDKLYQYEMKLVRLLKRRAAKFCEDEQVMLRIKQPSITPADAINNGIIYSNHFANMFLISVRVRNPVFNMLKLYDGAMVGNTDDWPSFLKERGIEDPFVTICTHMRNRVLHKALKQGNGSKNLDKCLHYILQCVASQVPTDQYEIISVFKDELILKPKHAIDKEQVAQAAANKIAATLKNHLANWIPMFKIEVMQIKHNKQYNAFCRKVYDEQDGSTRYSFKKIPNDLCFEFISNLPMDANFEQLFE